MPTPVSSPPCFNPQAPLIGRDGYEYEDAADCLAGKPAQCFRNEAIKRFRQERRSEKAVRLWIEGYDAGAEDFDFRAQRTAGAGFGAGQADRIAHARKAIESLIRPEDRTVAGVPVPVDPRADPAAAVAIAGW